MVGIKLCSHYWVTVMMFIIIDRVEIDYCFRVAYVSYLFKSTHYASDNSPYYNQQAICNYKSIAARAVSVCTCARDHHHSVCPVLSCNHVTRSLRNTGR